MNRSSGIALFCIAAAACSGTEGSPGTANDAPAPTAQPAPGARAAVERDLVLTLRRTTTDAFELDRDPRFEVVLTNRSRDTSYPVVLPSDGSESGWREPHVFFTVERRSSAAAAWEPLHANALLRCGNYAADWTDDVVSLAPGKDLTLPWFRFYPQWDLAGATHVRVVAHYVYGQGAKTRDLRSVPPALHAMPAYALSSNAMELAVEAPLQLEVAWKGPLPKNGEPLARSIDVVAVNRSARALPFAAADTGASLTIELEGVDSNGTVDVETLTTGVSVDDATDRIAPGARRDVVGASKAREDLPAGFRPRRVRASLQLWWYTDAPKADSDGRTARSPWVDIR